MSNQVKNAKKASFEYCECGCKGFSLKLGPLEYWIYNYLSDPPKFHLGTGHGRFGEHLGDFPSMEAADMVARDHAKSELEELLAELTAAIESL